MQTRIYRKKYVIWLYRFGGTSKKMKEKTSRDVYSDLDQSIYVIKSPIQLVRQSL
jgi:hypothetical protein